MNSHGHGITFLAVVALTETILVIMVLALSFNYRLDQHRDAICEQHGISVMDDCRNWDGYRDEIKRLEEAAK